ncbi:hypothetical protein Ahy_A03g015223 isoform C [Arachis hypogaea]|uniref:Uncharacterized protein n=1 Tax=Arachis hypogaea TaxID=3818 RepID=A0A445E003_ARAHY|nr:hypothetical protein Ahy_A03g015223 isoform C [Arachis hypogaea]
MANITSRPQRTSPSSRTHHSVSSLSHLSHYHSRTQSFSSPVSITVSDLALKLIVSSPSRTQSRVLLALVVAAAEPVGRGLSSFSYSCLRSHCQLPLRNQQLVSDLLCLLSPPSLLLCNISPARLQPVTSSPICSPLVLCASLRRCYALCSSSFVHFLCTLSPPVSSLQRRHVTVEATIVEPGQRTYFVPKPLQISFPCLGLFV